MSALDNISDQIDSALSRGLDFLKKHILGANNERLDFVMDSFYKLSPNQQTGVLVTLLGTLLVFICSAFIIYFSQIRALENELNESFEALHELRSLAQTYDTEQKRYRELTNIVRRSSQNFRPKPFFESKANQVGVSITDLKSSDVDIPPDSPLSADFKHVAIDFRLPKVSIPRMLKFLGEIEKSGKNLNINNLQIRTRYGDRLYFETSAKVIGYKVGGAR